MRNALSTPTLSACRLTSHRERERECGRALSLSLTSKEDVCWHGQTELPGAGMLYGERERNREKEGERKTGRGREREKQGRREKELERDVEYVQNCLFLKGMTPFSYLVS
jgi:hypothetical protein